MKKFIAVSLCLALLCLCACGQSEQVKTVDRLISSIGTVSTASGGAIEAAEQAYDALNEEQRSRVKDYETLLQARQSYDTLCAQKAIDAIAAIGEVTLRSADDINAAQVAWGALNETQRAMVPNAEDLEQAKQDYFDVQVRDIEQAIAAIGEVGLESESAILSAWAIYGKYDSDIQAAVNNFDVLQAAEHELLMARAQDAEQAISAIGEVTLQSAEAIQAARAVFDGYDAEVQEAVSNRSTLTDAEAKLQTLQVNQVVEAIAAIGQVSLQSGDVIARARTLYDQLDAQLIAQVRNADTLMEAETELARLQAEDHKNAVYAALDKLTVQRDETRNILWYYAPSEPYYADERSFVLPYLGRDGNSAWIRMKYYYTGTEWLFFEKVVITVDGEEYVREFDYFDVQRENSATVWEWADVQPDEADLELLEAMAGAVTVTVRFEGENSTETFTMDEDDKMGIRLVLDAYDLLCLSEVRSS